MDTFNLTLLTTTVAESAQANALAQGAVQAQLAACVQIETITSHYRWQGALEHSSEWRLVFKTLPEVAPALLAWVRANHPYEVPQLLLRTEQAQPDYGQWVREQVHATATGAGIGENG